MLVRICLLVLLAVAMATGPASAAEPTDDLQTELAELGVEDAVLARVMTLEAPPASLAPSLGRGSEVAPPVPLPGRVFRPPRARTRVV